MPPRFAAAMACAAPTCCTSQADHAADTMNAYALIKTVHIISSTVLSGLGAGTAFHMRGT